MYECNKCYHQFSGTQESVSACNCCEDGNFFEPIQTFKHEYSNELFDSYDACRDDLMTDLDEDDITDHFDFTKPEILGKFLRRKSNEDFIQWLSCEIDNAIELACSELITEYEEEE